MNGAVRTLRRFVSGDYMNSRSVHDEAQWRIALWTMKIHLAACYRDELISRSRPTGGWGQAAFIVIGDESLSCFVRG
jgi:hypothetical protein